MRKRPSALLTLAFCMMLAFVLAACGGGGGGGRDSYTIGGKISGLEGSGLVLQNNDGDNLTITPGAKSFTFATSVADGAGYAVTVLTQPDGQSCRVNSGTGAVSGTNVTGITLDCAQVLVSAFYNANGADWNDYVHGGDITNATDGACDPGVDTACLHGGEMRVVEVTEKTSCDGLTASDALGAFDWTCDDSTGTAKFISTGLKEGKNLSDLLDFDNVKWKDNSVMVLDGGVVYLTTSSAKWWNNPMAVDNDGGYLDGAGTIYVVTDDALITAYIINASSIGLVGQPGAIINGPGIYTSVISADGSVAGQERDFLWLEGAVDAEGDDKGVSLTSVRYSVLRDVAAENATNHCVYLDNSSNNTLSGVTASNSGEYGIDLEDSSYNTLSGVTASNNVEGVYLYSSSYNTLSGVTASNNGNGVYLYFSSNNALSGVTASNNSDGVYLWSSSNNALTMVTASNNTYGVYLWSSSNNALTMVTASNNTYGVRLDSSSNNALSGVAAANNGYGVVLFFSSDNYFTGPLKVGGNTTDCYVDGGTNSGLVDGTCTTSGEYLSGGTGGYGIDNTSDATLYNGVTLAASFVGKAISGDTANASDTNGTALYDDITDWVNFENPFRGWGIYNANAFPDIGHLGRCATGDTCQIWDWSLALGDTGDNSGPSILGVLKLPAGDDTLTHTWSDASETTFLRNAVEIQGDSIGNDNTLCESDETCLYTPNIGSYQGHGGLVNSVPAFTDGAAITGVTLKEYETNGY